MDLWDKKILYELDKNGRRGITQIAKKINKSKSFIKYRIENLMKKGVILDYVMIIDTSKLGYQTYDIFLQIFSKNSNENKIIDFLLKKKEINCIQKIIGKYQLYVSIFTKNQNELELFLFELLNEFKEIISNYKILLIYRAYSPSHNYLFDDSFGPINHNKEFLNSDKIDLSKKELRVLIELENNPRISFNEIAIKTNSSLSNVRNKFNNLVEKGVILYIRPSINANKLNLFHKIVLIKFKPVGILKINEMKKYFLSLKNTMFISYSFGEYDLSGEFIFNSLDEFRKFQEELFNNHSKNITQIEYLDYFEEVKYSHTPLK